MHPHTYIPYTPMPCPLHPRRLQRVRILPPLTIKVFIISKKKYAFSRRIGQIPSGYLVYPIPPRPRAMIRGTQYSIVTLSSLITHRIRLHFIYFTRDKYQYQNSKKGCCSPKSTPLSENGISEFSCKMRKIIIRKFGGHYISDYHYILHIEHRVEADAHAHYMT